MQMFIQKNCSVARLNLIVVDQGYTVVFLSVRMLRTSKINRSLELDFFDSRKMTILEQNGQAFKTVSESKIIVRARDRVHRWILK